MSESGHTWAVILAAGEGKRLHSLTKDVYGMLIPKQYCSLLGGSTLLNDALRRGREVAGSTRVCAIVAEQHRAWWQDDLAELDPANVIAQPANRGTGNGILLSLLWVLSRDPAARVVFLPADHFVENEAPLATAIQVAVQEVHRASTDLVLVGIEPDEPDPTLGYVVCGESLGVCRRVHLFVEKPSADVATRLLRERALWNSFIFAAQGFTLLNLFRRCLPTTADRMLAEVLHARKARSDGSVLAHLYATLPECDFSTDLLMHCPTPLRAVTTAACGWSDLGTPERVGYALGRLARGAMGDRATTAPSTRGRLSLASALMNSGG